MSFNVGVERIFLSHSPRIEKVEVVSRGVVRRARLFYLRDLAGKAARVRDRERRLSEGSARPSARGTLARKRASA